MFLIDIAVPRNIDPAVNDLGNVYLYNLDDLAELAEANAEGRQAEAQRAEAIVREEAEAFMRWFSSLDAVPTITSLTGFGEAIRRAELDRAIAALGPLSEAQRRVLDGLTNAIVRKLLHRPIARIRERAIGASPHRRRVDLFRLDDDRERSLRSTREHGRAPGRWADPVRAARGALIDPS
jgi:glutamyl-tRNA reductase